MTNSFRYTGREWDQETGLYYYRARYYDPSIGRFISEDPAGYNAGMNVYRYVRNNPLLFVDPLGLCNVTRIKLWSSDEVTVLSPRSPWVLTFHRQENAGDAVPVNILSCQWTREYNTSIHTTTTYLVHEVCDGVYNCQYRPRERFCIEKQQSWRTGTTTKTSNSGSQFILTGFDSDFLEELYCHQFPPAP
jgi:RHS repeat-associated protein